MMTLFLVLTHRCVNGDTLFHVAADVGSEFGIQVEFNCSYAMHEDIFSVQVFISQHIDINLLNDSNATPLHKARNPAIIKVE